MRVHQRIDVMTGTRGTGLCQSRGLFTPASSFQPSFTRPLIPCPTLMSPSQEDTGVERRGEEEKREERNNEARRGRGEKERGNMTIPPRSEPVRLMSIVQNPQGAERAQGRPASQPTSPTAALMKISCQSAALV
ncbi:unnamed protein product [Pleuronectes platessa]|uniref:Uncharacterized protein n=1 Tax=Pleuronectes platessa TaxID=8262 RepID=A0A9N7YPI6_PLEPL|nr:unnamed protein product [Pleuronectes platessa]